MKKNYENKLMMILVGLIVFGTLLFGRSFLSLNTLMLFANQLPEYGLIAMALMVTLIVSGVNLSVVAMTTLSGIGGAILMNANNNIDIVTVILGVSMMIIIGLLTGLINGVVISYLEVAPIIATLGTMLFFQGLSLNITKGGAITALNAEFTYLGSGSLLGIPIPIYIFAIVCIIIYWLLEKSEFGLKLYRIGKDPKAAKYSGIDVKKMTLLAYVLAGFIAGIAAIIMSSRYNSIRVDYGSSYLIYGIVIVSFGGVSLKGGKGSVRGVITSLIIVSVVTRLLNLASVDANVIEGIIGLMLLLSLIIQHLINKKSVVKTAADNK
ncbi:MAG: ABC transporter permease [Vallitaleaceae bacterium]|nr:ABC transporter permease [Vallitaleaceae bacterium]